MDFEISLPRDTYTIGEPIYLQVRLKNLDDGNLPVTPLKISSLDIAGNLGIILTRKDGVREFHPPYDGQERISSSPSPELLPQLETGGNWMIVVELLAYFSDSKGLISQHDGRIEISKGTYDLQAFYRWDCRPGMVIRSGVREIEIRKVSLRERWRQRKIRKILRSLRDHPERHDLLGLCRDVYAQYHSDHQSKDIIREAMMEGLTRDPLGMIGAFHVVDDHQEGPPLFLYDLITYREPVSEQENKEWNMFLDELAARWPDGFIGETAKQKKRFEEIAFGGVGTTGPRT